MADVTNKETKVPGVNQETHYIKREAHIIDAAGLGVTAVGTHDLFVLPRGGMITAVRAAMLGAGSGSSGATVQFKAQINGSSVALNSATAITALGSGAVINAPVSGVAAYDVVGSGAVIQLAVASAALTDFKALVVVESIPVADYLELG